MKILNFGSCNIDNVYSLEHITAPGETVSAKKMNRYPGGKGLNQSIALANAGAPVYHAGMIGSDGEFLLDIMRSSGVNTDLVKKVDALTGHAFIQVSKSGENSIVVYPGSNGMMTKEYIDSVLSHFGSGDFLLLQNEINLVPYIIEKAKKNGMKVIFNPSPFEENIPRDIDLAKLDYIVLNATEASYFAGGSEFIPWVRERYPELCVMLTLGSKGCIYINGQTLVSYPCYEVEAVDTTAAGDVFTGFFIASVSRGKTPAYSIKIASCAAAISVSRHGAASSVPTMKEVADGIGRMKLRHSDPMEYMIGEYFDKHYREASLEALADFLGFNPAYLSSWIKKHINTTFSELLQSKRCEVSERLLVQTDLGISEIINNVGYSNENFFRKIFMKKHGMTPLAYRKKYRETLI